MQPQISVILPVYNAEKYLAKCIESILQQTYPNIEVVIIDDGSTDSSKLICDNYARKDNRIVVYHTDNFGASHARNYGLEHFNGEYCVFVDSDDYVSKKYIEHLYYAIESVGAKILICAHEEISGTHIEVHNECGREQPYIFNICDYNYQDKTHARGAIWAAIYHRTIINSIRFDEDLYVGEDTLFFAKALNQCDKIAYLNEKLYYHIHRSNSLCDGKYDEKKFTGIIALQRACDVFFEQDDKIQESCRALMVEQCIVGAKRMTKEGSSNQKLFKELIRLARENRNCFMHSTYSWKFKISYMFFCLTPKYYLKLYKKVEALKKQ